jgi:hypothetical protein
VAVSELTELQSDETIRQAINDLSLFRCRLIALKPFSNGSKIRIVITHGGADLQALGKVVHSEPELAWELSSPPPNNTTSQKSGLKEARMLRKADKVPSLKLISEETPVERAPAFFVSAGAGNRPQTEPAFNVQNKAHNLVLVLVIYCLGRPGSPKLRLNLQTSQSLQARKRRWDASKRLVTALGSLGPGMPWKSGSLTKHWN